MKRNFITAIIASVMVVLAAGVLYIAMSVYATDQFTQVWTLTPTVIEKELKPLYSEEFDANSTEY
jgi:hypothetical protein